MENFVIVKKEKFEKKLLSFENFKKDFLEVFETGEVVCVHGPSGCGKSILTREVLNDYMVVEFDYSILKSRKTTQELFERITGTASVILLDDLDTTLHGWKYVHEQIVERKRITGPIVIIHRERERIESMFDKTPIYFVTPKPPTTLEIEKFGKDFIGNQNTNVLEHWDGENIRNFVVALNMVKEFNFKTSKPDKFYSTKDSIHDLLCVGGEGYERFIGRGIEEHGHVQDMIFSNFKTDSIEEYSRIIDSISESDKYDTHIYMGNWDLLPYFSLLACVIPSKINKNKIENDNLSPGTVWTKCYNQRMRQKAVETFFSTHRISRDLSTFSYLSALIKNKPMEDAVKLCRDYGITSQDIDLMNHITLKTKLKGKFINTLKRTLKHGSRPED